MLRERPRLILVYLSLSLSTSHSLFRLAWMRRSYIEMYKSLREFSTTTAAAAAAGFIFACSCLFLRVHSHTVKVCFSQLLLSIPSFKNKIEKDR